MQEASPTPISPFTCRENKKIKQEQTEITEEFEFLFPPLPPVKLFDELLSTHAS
jgi:hypothetical protein